jgi:hypothetical protein
MDLAMIPPRVHANGLPWLDWVAGDVWKCHGCGDSGRLPAADVVSVFARWLSEIKRDHARCAPPVGTGRAKKAVRRTKVERAEG